MPSSPEVRRERYQSTKNGTGTKPTTAAVRKPRGRRKPTANQIAQNIGTILELGNATALQLAPSYAPDSLQQYEIELLSKAAAAEILANAQLLRWYQSFGTSITGPHTLAAAALIAIALPRLARRGMVPAHLAGMGTSLALGMSNVGAEVGTDEPSGPAVQDDAGGAHSDNGTDGLREVHVGPGAPGLAFVPADSAFETGRRPVRD